MGLYRWNCGGQYRGKSWEQDLLADSQVCKVEKFPSVETAEKGHTCICGPIFAGHLLHSGKMCVPLRKLKRLSGGQNSYTTSCFQVSGSKMSHRRRG